MHDVTASSGARFTPAENANFIAAKAVAHAVAFAEGRNTIAELARNARSVQFELLGVPEDLQAKTILDACRLLVVAMMGTAWAGDDPRSARWQSVMMALVELVRHESLALRTETATARHQGRRA